MYRLVILVIYSVSVNGQGPTTLAPQADVVIANKAFVSPHPLNYPRPPGHPIFNGAYYNPVSATAPIVSYSNNRGIDGSYSFSFTTGDGKQAAESGFLKDAFVDNNGEPQGTQVVEGSYSYISPEGTPIQVNYVADENGFRPTGIHIPADGKVVLPENVVKPTPVVSPNYNAYLPFNYVHPYNAINVPHGHYNSLYAPFNGTYNPYVRPFDKRYNFDGRYNAFPTASYQPVNLPAEEEPKKDSE